MSDHWAELWRLFDELIELEADPRKSRLREIGARDAPLRDRLEAMLAADAEHEHGPDEQDQLIARSIVAAADPRAASDPLGLIGTSVGRYRVDALLGAGGMGVVYRSTDVTLGRDAALKFLPPALSLDAHAKQRFLHEARAASSLDHPNVCTIYEAGETTDGTLYIAMAFYAGETLRDRLDRETLDVGEALDLAVQAARGLDAAHARGLVHRDIKPANLLITADPTLKILDFGVAKAGDVALTLPEQRPGTIAYMAPEQALGEPVDARADLWSLGMVMYEMLTGRRPAAAGHRTERLSPPSSLRAGVPAAIDTLVVRLLARDPRDRPASAADVVRGLEREMSGSVDGGLIGFVRQHRALSAALSVAALVLAFAIGVLALQSLGPSQVAAEPLGARIERLVAERRFVEAFALAEDAEDAGDSDPLPRAVWQEIADWVTVTTEPAGNRVLAYLYLPRTGEPPFQTLVFTPGAGAFLGNTLSFETEWVIAPLIRAGRAAFTVVMSGMTEREWGADYRMPEPSSVAFRDLMVLHATELRIGLDYLETRPEIDTTGIAYVGVSMGAGSRLPWAAVDDRFGAVILVGGGIDERVHPTLPEASNINFAPYIRAPKLLLNGRNDEDHRWETRARPLWNLLTEPKDLVLVDGAGHLVPLERRTREMVDWLDRTLGPVQY